MNIKPFVKEHLPEILTGVGIAGIVASPFVMYRQAPKLRCDFRTFKQSWDTDDKSQIRSDTLAIIKDAAPVVGLTALTAASVLGSNRVSAKRLNTVATLLNASVMTATAYQNKVIEKFGAAKDEEIRAEVSKETSVKKAQTEFPPSYLCPNGYHCYESYFGHPFSCTRERLGSIQNKLGARILGNMMLSVNELFAELGIPPMECGDAMGWTVDNPLEFRYSTFQDENGDPVLDVSFVYPPKVDFKALW